MRHAVLSLVIAIFLGGTLVALTRPALAADRPIAFGEGLGYAVGSGSHGSESPYIHGRQVQIFARARSWTARLQPRLEFVSQSYDVDAMRLTQQTSEIQIDGGDRRVRAALASLQWNVGRPRPVRAYLVAGGGRAWIRDRTR
jgi:hypothetical protein